MTPRVLIALLPIALVCGCTTTTTTPAGSMRGPAETAEFYLESFYRSRMAKDLYLTLAPAARASLSYDAFILERQREIQLPGVDLDTGVARVEAAVLGATVVNERHQVLYAIQQVRFPYTAGEHNRYRVVRLHVVNERDQWYVEPFVDERTGTVRLLPALKSDALRNLYDHREAIAAAIARDIERMQSGEIGPGDEIATDASALEIPDLTGTLKPIPGEEAPAEERLAAYLEVGRLHFRTGQLDLAEEAFTSALKIDPLNATAKDYLERIRKTRQLEKEREEMIRLIERLLEAESSEKPEN